jgi:DNA-binding winged helix-turn-helix (wHTH) protein
MRAHKVRIRPLDRMDPALVASDSRVPEQRSAAIHLLNSSTGFRQHRSAARSTPMPATLPNEIAELLVDVDGVPVLIRLLVKDVPAEMQSDRVCNGADINSLLSSTLVTMIDRMRGSASRRDGPLKPPLAAAEPAPGRDALVRLRALGDETILRVGPLELDLLDRTAKRGDRQIDLRPREFRLLKYMMQRNDKLLTRATLLKEVWNYKFIPETNLVDVHMGRLRRKVDGPNEAPLIRNIRGAGFVLSTPGCSQGSPPRSAERPASSPPTFFQHAQHAT